MISQDQISQLMGATVYDGSGDKIGKVGQVYLDDQTGVPEWATVQTGLFGTKETLVPLSGAGIDGDRVTVSVDKQQVKDAPRMDDDGHLSQEDEAELYTYYGMQYTEAGSDSGLGTTDGADYDSTTTTDTSYTGAGTTTDASYATGTVGRDTSGAMTDDAMTRSEERVRIGTQQVEAGRARLRKYIVSENVTQTVPVSREEIRIEREPITAGTVDAAYDGPALSEEVHEVVLHEERAVVDKDVVAVERVRLDKDVVTEQQTVTTDVRKEQIELETDAATAPSRIDPTER